MSCVLLGTLPYLVHSPIWYTSLLGTHPCWVHTPVGYTPLLGTHPCWVHSPVGYTPLLGTLPCWVHTPVGYMPCWVHALLGTLPCWVHNIIIAFENCHRSHKAFTTSHNSEATQPLPLVQCALSPHLEMSRATSVVFSPVVTGLS